MRLLPTTWSRRLLPALLLATACEAQAPEELRRRFVKAEREVVRLPASAFPELPANLAAELKRRGCTVPQTWTPQPHNVIRGEFTRPRQTDWAVLCSVNGVSTILVFRGGADTKPAELAPLADIDRLQSDAGDRIVFSRLIRPAGREFIRRSYRAYGGQPPPPLDHQGIDDAFLEKASVVHYFLAGSWRTLTGSD